MRGEIAACLAASVLAGCSMVPYYGEAKAVADAGVAIAVEDRRAFNDKKLAISLAALCDNSVGAVNRYPDAEARELIDRLCGGEGQGVSMDRLSSLLRALDRMRSSGS